MMKSYSMLIACFCALICSVAESSALVLDAKGALKDEDGKVVVDAKFFLELNGKTAELCQYEQSVVFKRGVGALEFKSDCASALARHGRTAEKTEGNVAKISQTERCITAGDRCSIYGVFKSQGFNDSVGYGREYKTEKERMFFLEVAVASLVEEVIKLAEGDKEGDNKVKGELEQALKDLKAEKERTAALEMDRDGLVLLANKQYEIIERMIDERARTAQAFKVLREDYCRLLDVYNKRPRLENEPSLVANAKIDCGELPTN